MLLQATLYSHEAQTYKTTVETAIMLLCIDDIVSGHKKKDNIQQEHPRRLPHLLQVLSGTTL
ncbi:uncharacterized protein V6R79_017587 [Siganus canaliculatus]